MQVDGFLLLNKPKGLSSNAALQKVKHLFAAKKAGHTGSLDPLATGMLPICFGEATKFSQFLLDADKSYITTGLLGIKTSTADAEGEVIARKEHFDITQEAMLEAIERFKGQTQQKPSMYSALKHKGRPLYEYARAGVEIERQARSIQVERLILKAFDGQTFELQVTCSKGTYIRNLVEDIGDVLGVGAHVLELHRSYTAGLEHFEMQSLEQLQEMSESERQSCLLPVDSVVVHLPKIILQDADVIDLMQGKSLSNVSDASEGQIFRLYDLQEQFLGIAEQLSENSLKPKRLINTAVCR